MGLFDYSQPGQAPVNPLQTVQAAQMGGYVDPRNNISTRLAALAKAFQGQAQPQTMNPANMQNFASQQSLFGQAAQMNNSNPQGGFGY